jgi:nucleotide-binding universal stress UspA family protein
VSAPRAYPHIACCVEDSPGSRAALEEAAGLRDALGPGRLTVLHVRSLGVEGGIPAEGAWLADPSESDAVAAAWLDELTRRYPSAEPLVVQGGHAASVVCEWAEAHAVDLLVAGGYRGRLERIYRGSFAAHLVHRAPCTVMIARPGAPTR